LSREARVRLAWMDFYRRSRNVAHTCRHFGVSRQTFYRWQRRYDPYDLTTLEERSHCPRQRRLPTWSFPLEEKVLRLRLQFPRWGKDKLAVLLRRQKLAVATSMVGRILTRLKQQGRLVEPPRTGVRDRAALCVPVPTRCANPSNTRCRSPATWSKLTPWTCVPSRAWSLNSSPPAIWFPAGTCCKLTLAPLPKLPLFLDTLQHRMPFPIRAVQLDGGPEFAAEFEPACQQRGLHLFVLPPRSPKLNGAVERANRTHTEEFYQVTACSLEMKKLNRELRHWEKIYNTVRPHQALGYLTPLQFLRQISSQRKE
jgi:putative transposase